MNEVSIVAGAMGFVASETSTCDELTVAAAHCARSGQTLVVSSRKATAEAQVLIEAHPGLDVTLDSRAWTTARATPDFPTAISDTLLDLDAWTDVTLEASGAQRLLAPGLFVALDDHASLREQLRLFAAADHPGLVPFVATDAEVLRAKHLPDFIGVLQASSLDRFAFLFAYKKHPLAHYDRLHGLRQLLAAFPGCTLVGADVPAGTDAIVHGASWVGIGASSSRRMERRPGDGGGGAFSADYLPGAWMRELMEMRSPSIYADWYANSVTPTCPRCRRPLESYQPTPQDKTLLIAHNLHGITDFAAEIFAVAESERAGWLDNERVEAFLRHGRLTPAGAKINADETLRRLCELDDPHYRMTSPAGVWK